MGYDKKYITIIPTYNENNSIIPIVDQIMDLKPPIDILIIDDNSSDGTREKLDYLKNKYLNKIHILNRENKLGYASAIVLGMKYGIKNDYDFILTMDADGSHNPKTIEEFILSSKTFDLTIGSRYSNGMRVVNWNLFRLSLSYFGNKIVKYILNTNIADYTSGYRCYNTKFLRAINLDIIKSNGYAFQIEMLFRYMNLSDRISELPIIYYERKSGKSKFQIQMILEAILVVTYLKLEKWINS